MVELICENIEKCKYYRLLDTCRQQNRALTGVRVLCQLYCRPGIFGKRELTDEEESAF